MSRLTPEELAMMCDVLRPPELKELVGKLRYMGKQYGAGQASRGGSPGKHSLEEAADELDKLFARTIDYGQEIADLRNVVQAACIDGLPGMAAAWEKYFPDHPISLAAPKVEQEAPAVPTTTVCCWLVELFYRGEGGPSLRRYHTGLTDINVQSRATDNVHEAKRYASKDEAASVLHKLNLHMSGLEWRAVEHGFHAAVLSEEREALKELVEARAQMAGFPLELNPYEIARISARYDAAWDRARAVLAQGNTK